MRSTKLGLRLGMMSWLVLLSLIGGCRTTPSGHIPARSPTIILVAVPAGLAGSQSAQWEVRWSGGVAPFSITMDMGGGATPNAVFQHGAASPFAALLEMVNDSRTDYATYEYTITVTDADNCTATASANYSVGPNTNQPPVIDETATVFFGGVLTVVATDPDGDPLTASLAPIPELIPDAYSKAMAQAVTATFTFTVTDIFAGASGTCTITVSDDYGGADTYDVAITIGLHPPPADTLIATPLDGSVAISEPVTIIVFTTVPANAFQYMNGVGVTIENDAELVAQSFNVGVPGGYKYDADGFWASMDPGGGFLLQQDLFQSTNIGDGRERWDFYLSPICGSDQTTAEGALFNFQFEFSQPGVKTLGFQEETGVVKRTYYSDSKANEYFWGDISNDGSVAGNSILVE